MDKITDGFITINKFTEDADGMARVDSSDIYNLSVILNQDIIITEFENVISEFSKGSGFISYKNTSYCSSQLEQLMQLTKLVLNRKPEDGKKIVYKGTVLASFAA